MNEKISITLPSEMAEEVNARVEAGLYASSGDVLRAAFSALEREEQAIDRTVDAGLKKALADDRPGIPADVVFERLERLHASNMRDR